MEIHTGRFGALLGLVALHLRGGDLQAAFITKWGAYYMGINQHSSLPDRFNQSPYVNDANVMLSYYLDHCWTLAIDGSGRGKAKERSERVSWAETSVCALKQMGMES